MRQAAHAPGTMEIAPATPSPMRVTQIPEMYSRDCHMVSSPVRLPTFTCPATAPTGRLASWA